MKNNSLTNKDAVAVRGAGGGGLDAPSLPPLSVVLVAVRGRRRRLLLELGGPQQPPGGELHGDEVPGVRADVDDEPKGFVRENVRSRLREKSDNNSAPVRFVRLLLHD